MPRQPPSLQDVHCFAAEACAHWGGDSAEERFWLVAADACGIDPFFVRVASEDPFAFLVAGQWIVERGDDGVCRVRDWEGDSDPHFASADELGAFGKIDDAAHWPNIDADDDAT